MLNQYAETPDLETTSRGEVIPHSTKSQVTSITPTLGSARVEKAVGNRSRWFVPQPGHSSTIIAVILFPDGPVTLIQAPQFAAVAQFESERAVPKRDDGMVYVLNEHAPPAVFPP